MGSEKVVRVLLYGDSLLKCVRYENGRYHAHTELTERFAASLSQAAYSAKSPARE